MKIKIHTIKQYKNFLCKTVIVTGHTDPGSWLSHALWLFGQSLGISSCELS